MGAREERRVRRRRQQVWLGRVLGAVVLVVLGCVPQTLQSVSASVHVTTVDAIGRIAAGDEHTCAINNDNTVWCWGDNSLLQLGVNLPGNDTFTTTPIRSVTLPSARRPIKITAGSMHTCVLASDGTVWCWGDNGFGSLGNGSTLTTEIPQQVSLPDSATHVVAGGSTTCAVLENTMLYCWGRNNVGQVGIGSTDSPKTSAQRVTIVPSSFEVRDIEVGAVHVCAVSVAGAVWCWGSNANGQLGNSSPSDALLPVATAVLGSSATMVSSGSAHSCVVLVDHSLKCFGSNSYGQLGLALTTASSSTPTAVPVGDNVDVVATGMAFTCALTSLGAVKCLGRNQWGQLGSGATSTTPRIEAAIVSGLGSERAVHVVAGSEHACAVMQTGLVKCWGNNRYGQVGVNNGEQPQTGAVTVGVLNVVPTTTTVAPTTAAPNPTEAPTTQVSTTAPQGDSSTTVTTTTVTTSAAPPTVSPNTSFTTTTGSVLSQTQKTTVKKSLVRPISLRRGAKVSATSIAAAVSMTVPKTSKGSMRIVIVSGGSRCVFRGSTIVGIRAGRCSVAVTLMPKNGRQTTRQTTITVR